MDFVLYHGGCTDGWAAAYIASKRYPDAKLLAMAYSQPIPFERLKGKDVLVVDFSWPRAKISELLSQVSSLSIFEHHKWSAQELEVPFADNYYFNFDVNRSGAGITWDVLFPNDPRPWWVNYVEDGDLWKFTLGDSRAVNAYLHALPKRTARWDALRETKFADVALHGYAIQMHIETAAEHTASEHMIGEWHNEKIAVVNCPGHQSSDVGELLYKTKTKAVLMWFERNDGMVKFMLRSAADGPDVGGWAKGYPGGGGHTHSAGFELPIPEARKFLDVILGRNSR